MKKETTFIYALCHPETNEIKYIGKTSHPKKRLTQHICSLRSNHKSNWIRSLLNEDLYPKMIIISEVKITEWEYWEQYYIDKYKKDGCKLTNQTKGGRGGADDRTLMPDTIKKMRLAQLGKKHTPETKEKQRQSKLELHASGAKPYLVGLKKAQEINKTNKELGIKKTPETTEKWLSSRKNNGKLWHTPDTCEKIRKTSKGRKRSSESIAKMVKANSIPVVQLTMNGEFIREWESMKHAVVELDIKGHAVYDVLHKKVGRKSYKGNKWMLKSEWELIEIN